MNKKFAFFVDLCYYLSKYSKELFLRKEKNIMAKIIAYEKCKTSNYCGEFCPYPKCPGRIRKDCHKCLNRCPCCSGAENGFCDQCTEDCDNRNKQYDPNAISY